MALSLRQLRNRIRNIGNIRKMTSAMEMISVSKLAPSRKALSGMKEYLAELERLTGSLLRSFPAAAHPLLIERPQKNVVCLCLFTSDTGLCGSYNNSAIRAAEDFIMTNNTRAIKLVIVGKKGLNHFLRYIPGNQDISVEIKKSCIGTYGRYNDAFGEDLCNTLTGMFTSGECDEVYVLYTRFESVLHHLPVLERVLNVRGGKGNASEYLLEPDLPAILNDLLPLYVAKKIRMMAMSAFASEHAARMVAMGEATENAEDVLNESVLLRNKLRQANITREIIEVISAADALRG